MAPKVLKRGTGKRGHLGRILKLVSWVRKPRLRGRAAFIPHVEVDQPDSDLFVKLVTRTAGGSFSGVWRVQSERLVRLT